MLNCLSVFSRHLYTASPVLAASHLSPLALLRRASLSSNHRGMEVVFHTQDVNIFLAIQSPGLTSCDELHHEHDGFICEPTNRTADIAHPKRAAQFARASGLTVEIVNTTILQFVPLTTCICHLQTANPVFRVRVIANLTILENLSNDLGYPSQRPLTRGRISIADSALPGPFEGQEDLGPEVVVLA